MTLTLRSPAEGLDVAAFIWLLFLATLPAASVLSGVYSIWWGMGLGAVMALLVSVAGHMVLDLLKQSSMSNSGGTIGSALVVFGLVMLLYLVFSGIGVGVRAALRALF